MFDRVVGFFLASCVHNGILRLGMLRHKVMGMRLRSNGVEACYVDGGGYIWKEDVKVERFDLPPLCRGGCR